MFVRQSACHTSKAILPNSWTFSSAPDSLLSMNAPHSLFVLSKTFLLCLSHHYNDQTFWILQHYSLEKSIPPLSSTFTNTLSPLRNSPASIFSESGFVIYFWIVRLSGRAP